MCYYDTLRALRPGKAKRRLQFLVLSFLLAAFCLNADGEVRHSVSWAAVPGAEGYLLEVVNEQQEPVLAQRVQGNSAELMLYPGSYFFRVTALQRLQRPEAERRWTAFQVLAAGPPDFLFVVPDTLPPGMAQSVLVVVDDLARDGSVSFKSPSGEEIPATAELVSRIAWRVRLPALERLGEYSLVLTNPPGQATTVQAALRVRHPPPAIAALQPDRFQGDHPPQSLRLLGSGFTQLATAAVSVNGETVELPVVSRNAEQLIVALPRTLPPGEYRLMVRNEPDGDPVDSPILTVMYPAPTIARLQPERFPADRIPRTLLVFGKGFSPQVAVSMMADGKRLDLPLVAREPGSLRVGLPRALGPGDYTLTIRNEPEAEGTNTPPFRVSPVPEPAEAGAPARDLLVSGGWNCLIPLSSLADLYSPSARGAEVGVDFCLTPNRNPERRASLSIGGRASAQYSACSSIASSGVFAESVLSMYSVSLAPALELSLPFLALRLYSGGGVVYSRIEGEDAVGDAQFAQSIDFLALARLAVDIPLLSFLRVGLAAEYRHFFLTEPMDALSLGSGLVVAFPLH